MSPTHIEFGWESSVEVGGAAKLESYNVYIGTTLVQTVSAQTLEYTHSEGLTAGNSYKVSISAVSLIGEGPKSNPLTMWAIDVPSAPTALTLTQTSRDSCSVQWTAINPPPNSLITGYVVLIDDGLDGAFSVGYDGSSNPSKVFTTVENLTQQTTYRLKVYALNKAGKG